MRNLDTNRFQTLINFSHFFGICDLTWLSLVVLQPNATVHRNLIGAVVGLALDVLRHQPPAAQLVQPVGHRLAVALHLAGASVGADAARIHAGQEDRHAKPALWFCELY